MRNLPHTLNALLARGTGYFGHDTGISATGAPSTLLCGPTDSSVWAPAGEHVRIIRAPGGDLARLAPDAISLPQVPAQLPEPFADDHCPSGSGLTKRISTPPAWMKSPSRSSRL